MSLPADVLIRWTFTILAATSLVAVDHSLQAQEPAEPAVAVPDDTAKPTEPAAPESAPAAAPANKIVIESPAKPYRQLPFAASLKDDPRRQNAIYKTVSAVLSGNEPLPENEAVVKGYYTQFMFAKLTQLAPDTGLPVNDLPDVRTRILRDIQRAQGDPLRELLLETTYTYMIGIVRGHFHPLAQYNAMLIIGELNSDEARTGGGSPSPPIPLSAALADMVRELENPAQNDGVRLAALIGLKRHMRLDGQKAAGQRMPAAKKVATVAAVSKLIFDAKPAYRSDSGQKWMRRMAVEIVGLTHDAGVENRNAIEFSRILADENEPRSLRFAAGLAFSQLEFDKAPPVNPKDVVANLARLTLDSALNQLTALRAESEQRVLVLKGPVSGYGEGLGEPGGSIGLSGGSSSGGLEEYGDLGGGDPFAIPGEEFGSGGLETGGVVDTAEAALSASRQYLVDNAARSLVYDLHTCDVALRGRQPATKGLSGMADPTTTQIISDLAARYKSLYKIIADNRKDLPALTTSLEGEVSQLQAIVAKVAPPAVDPAGLPGDEPVRSGGLPADDGGLPPGDGGLPGVDDGGLPGVDDGGLPVAP